MTTNRHTAAAEALAASFPASSTLTVTAVTDHTSVPVAGTTVTASYVGAPSVDLAVILAEATALLGADTAGLRSEDVLTPALAAAAGVLGNGVLSPSTVGSAAALIDDADLYALNDAAGAPVAWFVIRTRPAASSDALDADELAGNLKRISNVEMSLTVEIGRTRMSVREVLGLEPGNVVELDRSAGAPADVLLNGRKVALGEIVVVDQDYAVRITKILDPSGEQQ
ncbi:flagellar motor switch protein FliN [Curtobacterium sp. MCSS17_016]|uniref:flagellar motor switch protein FliN n=1 Tax=Curtobacterium sp. MCSS17_016 TaxID=2175644 RepID=UPI000DAA4D0A|nr:flagellar motor switch protein FliN [Curtobacterium sp. MCSS17_016]WIE80900.1 flagellar motor switch protein FliN [Curtobacterium sp. MCSS17_016]